MKAYIDEVARAYNVHVAAATGNITLDQCPDANRSVQSPGTAWNVLTVGGIEDNNNGNWTGDTVWTGHCFGDPTGGNFKPEIAAPATCVVVGGATCGWEGSSVAAPQVAGGFGLIVGQNPTELRYCPETTKAVLLAASFAHRTCCSGVVGDGVPEPREGLGSLTTEWANRIVRRQDQDGDFGHFTFFGGGSGCYTKPSSLCFSVSPVAGRKARFVITWQSHGFYDAGPNGYGGDDDYSDARLSDIDLYVRTAGGTSLDSSTYANCNVEWVEWTARTAEMPYKVEIRPYSWDCSLASEVIGWAWAGY